jgi:hypothetical protein
MWPGNERGDARNYQVLGRRPFPLLCVIGNHEPVLGRPDLPEEDIGIGEKVILVREQPCVAYLKRGKIYTIDGFTFLALGGALSVDRQFRKSGQSWWEGEYWSGEEKEALLALLAGQNHFDYVLSHTGPDRVNQALFKSIVGPHSPKFRDEVAALNETIDGMIACKGWFCGHWHRDNYFYDAELKREYWYLYDSTALLRRTGLIAGGLRDPQTPKRAGADDQPR